VKNLFVVQTQDPATQRRFNRIWTKIKTGQ